MSEAVRLVIWDLDETFWQGTLTEGGITYNDETHNIVIELARRGIMSSICSKNDFETVKKLLVEKGIWDYFIFPSINWEPKGPRIAALVDAVQLRPETLMLIDDNPMNLNETKHFVPGIQVSDEKIIPEILGSKLFKGKNDSELSRLKQYKLLERRKADEAEASVGGNNYDFLRSSNVRVIIEHDVEKHIDRAVELINRTNQLNFTKERLPEDPEQARAELRKMLSNYRLQAGLVRVVDNYGDYGLCGLYIVSRGANREKLLQLCFSCRILNMGVEAWLYRHLGRPELEVSGEVLSDPKDESIPADWITLVDAGAEQAGEESTKSRLNVAYIRGGCDLRALQHYLGQTSKKVVDELNIVRNGLQLRIDHSMVMRHAMDGLDKDTLSAFGKLGYEPSDFTTEIFPEDGSNACWIFSFWKDSTMPVFRHKGSQKLIPFAYPLRPDQRGQSRDQILQTWKLAEIVGDETAAQMLQTLQTEFEHAGYVPAELFEENLTRIFSKIPASGRVFIVNGTETLEGQKGKIRNRYNELTRQAAKRFPNVSVIGMDEIADPTEEAKKDHYDRMTYFKLYERIRDELSGGRAQKPAQPRFAPAGQVGQLATAS